MKEQLLILTALLFLVKADYWEDRLDFIHEEEAQALGGSLELNEREEIANKKLMALKIEEYDAGLKNSSDFLPAQHFFSAKTRVEQSKVFKLLQKLPKGAALHGHDTALASNDYVYNLTFAENLYACVVDGRLRFKFALKVPDESCQWSLLSELRKSEGFEEFLDSQLHIVEDDPHTSHPDIDAAWTAFQNTFATVESLVLYKPLFKEYFYQALLELYEDNVKYLEFRGTLPSMYDLNGTEYGPIEVAALHIEALNEFLEDYPDFVGAKLIYAPYRRATNDTVANYIKTAVELKAKFPDFIAGFDLVGQEDKGEPLASFIGEIQKAPEDLNFFFHAGETNWQGASTDFNLVDAVLLGTKRIGHGYALTKHPKVLEVIKDKDIAIEVCPISNQVLKLVADIRNHPAVTLIAEGYPVVISYDDPSFWQTKGLSYDWYMAFMGMSGRNGDLRFLKQLALNSLKYSALDEEKKEAALKRWAEDWEEFINYVISST